MKRVEIPIWQGPDAKPIPGFPPMPKTIIKWFNDEEYEAYMNPKPLDWGFNQGVRLKGWRHGSGDVYFEAFKLTPEREIIRTYKKAAMYL